jgi:putative aminopeptidase FrvX
MSELVDLLSKLSELLGPSGSEDDVRSFIVSEAKPLATGMHIDSMGNLYAEVRRKKERPKLMVSAHMDEVGFVVKYVESSGQLRVGPIGLIDPRILPGQRVTVRGTSDYPGTIGSKPPHILTPDESKRIFDFHDLYIDFGASSREEAERLGVHVGTNAVFDVPFKHTASDSMVLGKALDNRAGCAAALMVMRALSKSPPTCNVEFAFTVQEEPGMRGAQVAAAHSNPDAAIVLETAVAADSPDVSPRDHILEIGKGPAIRVMDASMITQKKMLQIMLQVAERNKIGYQYHVNLGGATDAGRIHLSGQGIPTGVISTPARYLHSPSTILSLRDLEDVAKLTEYVVRGIESPDQL